MGERNKYMNILNKNDIHKIIDILNSYKFKNRTDLMNEIRHIYKIASKNVPAFKFIDPFIAEKHQKVIEMFHNNIQEKEIADELGYNIIHVRDILKKANLYRTGEAIKKIRLFYNKRNIEILYEEKILHKKVITLCRTRIYSICKKLQKQFRIDRKHFEQQYFHYLSNEQQKLLLLYLLKINEK